MGRRAQTCKITTKRINHMWCSKEHRTVCRINQIQNRIAELQKSRPSHLFFFWFSFDVSNFLEPSQSLRKENRTPTSIHVSIAYSSHQNVQFPLFRNTKLQSSFEISFFLKCFYFGMFIHRFMNSLKIDRWCISINSFFLSFYCISLVTPFSYPELRNSGEQHRFRHHADQPESDRLHHDVAIVTSQLKHKLIL